MYVWNRNKKYIQICLQQWKHKYAEKVGLSKSNRLNKTLSILSIEYNWKTYYDYWTVKSELLSLDTDE